MRKIDFNIALGSDKETDSVEIDENASEEEIQKALEDWVWEKIDAWYEIKD